MPLIPVARAATPDPSLRAVRFVMKDGCRPVVVLVSRPALEDIELPSSSARNYFDAFKQYRKVFERIASDKYERGHVELDSTICIRSMDVPRTSTQ